VLLLLYASTQTDAARYHGVHPALRHAPEHPLAPVPDGCGRQHRCRVEPDLTRRGAVRAGERAHLAGEPEQAAPAQQVGQVARLIEELIAALAGQHDTAARGADRVETPRHGVMAGIDDRPAGRIDLGVETVERISVEPAHRVALEPGRL